MAPDALSIVIDVDSADAVQKLKQVDAAIDGVTTASKQATPAISTYESAVRTLIDSKTKLYTVASQLTGSLTSLRAGLNEIAAGAGLTVGSLGLLNAGMLVVGAAMAGWSIGRAIADFFGLDKAIANATARLIGWGNVAAQESGAKQDVINLAVRRGADAMITYAAALDFNAKWFVEWQAKAKDMDDVAARIHAPAELAKQMHDWNAEIDLVRSAGSLPALTAGLNSHVISVKELSASYRISEGAINLFKQQLADDARAHTKAAAEATKHAAELNKLTLEHQRFVDSVRNLTSSSAGAVKGFGAYGQLITDISARSGAFRDGLDDLNGSMNTFHGGLSIAGDELTTVTIPAFSKLPDVVAQATDAINDTRRAVVSLGQEVGDHLQGALANIPNLLVHAFTAGGGVMGAIKAIGVEISTAILEPLSKKLSTLSKEAVGVGSALAAGIGGAAGGGTVAAVGALASSLAGVGIAAHVGAVGMAAMGTAGAVGLAAATAGIGLAAVGVALLIKHWHDHKKMVEENTKSINTFVTSMFTLATQTQVTESGNQRWALTVIQVRDAYLATGRTAAQAEHDVKAMWDAASKGAAATKAAMDLINQAFIEQKQDATDLDAAVQKYGFTIEELGPAMQRQELTKQAVQLENDFRLLVGAGVDLNTVLQHMGGSINDFIHLAQKTGQEVPSEMKPILEKMIEMGTLTDQNGNAITNLGDAGITFSETMTQGFQRVVDKLTDLINSIAKTTGAINAIPTQKTITINYDDPGPPQGSYGSRGGLVTASGIQYLAGGGHVLAFRPRGTDTVPAMLTPGERVLSVKQNRAYEAGGGGTNVSIGAINVSQEMDEHQAEELIGKTVVRAMRKRGVRF